MSEYLDVHNHILFGVDDGIKTIEESIETLKKYKENGIDTIFLTPHVEHPTVKTDINKIKENFEILKDATKDLNINLFLGSELYLQTNKKQQFIPLKDWFILIELPTTLYPMYLLDRIFDLQLEGYEVILAHVERYPWLLDNEKLIDKLKTMNVYFQMNLESLHEKNYYIKNDLIDFIATDYHGKKRKPLDLSLFKKFDYIVEKSKKILKL
ncbi:capsular polysaccharide biosynthesis protein [Marinitoga piezophila KA3]|uniref:protein-tyrosine-phosphatase n=1 Tax=Marinitoga piezophila (strain DSM 14283 / JCM 11233 / KA3) TaxID=443254 RepID=H2J8E2_MARPK|nr:CpsB/CapC family capsule biosynthesis tyrosine phosphatase [Marinitoga piezophila]AEX85626.1 capsular polysaccharide biosynthesis protein [Marinitoga piezophila KA3]